MSTLGMVSEYGEGKDYICYPWLVSDPKIQTFYRVEGVCTETKASCAYADVSSLEAAKEMLEAILVSKEASRYNKFHIIKYEPYLHISVVNMLE